MGSPAYDWAFSYLQKYPELVEDVQNIVSKEDISSGVDIILSILRIGSTVFLLSDLMMLSGVIMSNVHGKWLILPWICFNVLYNIFIFAMPVFLFSSFAISLFTWRFLICVFLIIAVCFNKFIIYLHPIDVVIKQFTDKKSGLKSWKTISADLTSDRVCLVA